MKRDKYRPKRAITSLSLKYEISIATNSSFIKGSNKTKNNKILKIHR